MVAIVWGLVSLVVLFFPSTTRRLVVAHPSGVVGDRELLQDATAAVYGGWVLEKYCGPAGVAVCTQGLNELVLAPMERRWSCDGPPLTASDLKTSLVSNEKLDEAQVAIRGSEVVIQGDPNYWQNYLEAHYLRRQKDRLIEGTGLFREVGAGPQEQALGAKVVLERCYFMRTLPARVVHVVEGGPGVLAQKLDLGEIHLLLGANPDLVREIERHRAPKDAPVRWRWEVEQKVVLTAAINPGRPDLIPWTVSLRQAACSPQWLRTVDGEFAAQILPPPYPVWARTECPDGVAPRIPLTILTHSAWIAAAQSLVRHLPNVTVEALPSAKVMSQTKTSNYDAAILGPSFHDAPNLVALSAALQTIGWIDKDQAQALAQIAAEPETHRPQLFEDWSKKTPTLVPLAVISAKRAVNDRVGGLQEPPTLNPLSVRLAPQPWETAAMPTALILFFGAFLYGWASWRYRALEAKQREQQQLWDVVQHELMAPLASLRVNLRTMGPAGLQVDQMQKDLELAIRSVQQMSSVADIMAERISANDVVDLAEDILRPEVFTMTEKSRIEGRQVQITVLGALPRGCRVSAATRWVLRNLISNAARYGDGRVEIAVTDDGAWVRVAVRDYGIGVPAEVDLEQLSRLGYRSVEAKARGAGAGVGLFLVQAVLRQIGGHLALVGHANPTTFEVRLRKLAPRSKVAP